MRRWRTQRSDIRLVDELSCFQSMDWSMRCNEIACLELIIGPKFCRGLGETRSTYAYRHTAMQVGVIRCYLIEHQRFDIFI